MGNSSHQTLSATMSRRVLIDAAVGVGLLVMLVAVVLWDSSREQAAPTSIDLVFILDDGDANSEAIKALKENCLAQAKQYRSEGTICRFAVVPFGDAGNVPSIALTADFGKFAKRLKSTPEEDQGHSSNDVSDALQKALEMEFGEKTDVYFYVVSNTPMEDDDAIDDIAQRMKKRRIPAIVQAKKSEQDFYRPLYRHGCRFFSLTGEDLTEQKFVDAGKITGEARQKSLLSQKERKRKDKAPPKVHMLYTKVAGKSVIEDSEKDKFGNPVGSQYDLGRDGAFEGLQIAVLQLYSGFNFSLPQKALETKGFSIHRWVNRPPEVGEFKRVLEESSQLWIISDQVQRLSEDHLNVITEFFESGRGVYLWGDNEPYFADANYVSNAILGARLQGNLRGSQVVGRKTAGSISGVVEDHLISTGIETIYEGITISTVVGGRDLQPLVYGSAGQVVVSTYDRDKKRLILDGGFTRLYTKWDTAGTGRYVQNAAAWLVNYERFGDDLFKDK